MIEASVALAARIAVVLGIIVAVNSCQPNRV